MQESIDQIHSLFVRHRNAIYAQEREWGLSQGSCIGPAKLNLTVDFKFCSSCAILQKLEPISSCPVSTVLVVFFLVCLLYVFILRSQVPEFSSGVAGYLVNIHCSGFLPAGQVSRSSSRRLWCTLYVAREICGFLPGPGVGPLFSYCKVDSTMDYQGSQNCFFPKVLNF